MDDYLLSEREQWEALKRGVREYAPAVLVGIAIAALGLGGWRWWQARQNGVELAAGAMFFQMESAFERGDATQAFILLGDLERTYPSSPYADQARLASAKAFVEDGQFGKAAGELGEVMRHSNDSILRLIARLRLARVQIAQHQPSQALATLSGADPGALAPQYAVARGDAYYAMGNKSAALAQYRLAKATDTGGATDTGLLDLEIADLAADIATPGAPPPSASHTAPAAPAAPATPAAAGGQHPRKP